MKIQLLKATRLKDVRQNHRFIFDHRGETHMEHTKCPCNPRIWIQMEGGQMRAIDVIHEQFQAIS